MEDNEHNIESLVTEELLPLLNKMLQYLESIQQETKKVQKLNQLEIEAQKFGYDTFSEYANILQNGNDKEIDAMYEDFEEYDKVLQEKYEEVEDKREKSCNKKAYYIGVSNQLMIFYE